jgi:hypothetical protein
MSLGLCLQASDCENAWQVGLARRAEKGSLIFYPQSGDAFLFQYAEAFADEVECFLKSDLQLQSCFRR